MHYASMMPLRTLVVDFNSYFASVEQQERPGLRGKPVAVVPLMADSTCCIAASYEAKDCGVTTGTNVAEAKRLCPGIRLIEADHEIYIRYHERLIAAVESCVHVDEVMSIDEMACALPVNYQEPEQARALALRIKAAIAEQVGECLRCSIGIAPNRFLAKTASDMQKPDGLVVLQKSDLPEKLFTLELRDLCGIGANMEARLKKHGIYTVRELCLASETKLRRVWGGIEGERLHHRLRGESVYTPPTRKTTIGHSHVLPPAKRNEADACAILDRLLQKAAMRLRHIGHLAGGLSFTLKYERGHRWDDAMILTETQDTLEFLRVFQMLWKRRPPDGRKITAVGVDLFNLVPADSHTPSLFERTEDRRKLNKAVDALNVRFGKQKVFFGGAFTARSDAPMRIAFNHIPDPTIEGD
jgi:DNA polymerase-4